MNNIGYRLMSGSGSMSYQVMDDVTDIDRITRTGNFFIENPAAQNLPLAQAGYLTIRTTSTKAQLFQYYQGHDNPKLFMRFAARAEADGVLHYDFGTWIELADPEKIGKTITYGTQDITPGSTPLATGSIYLVYE